jgi:energy-coupling factor transporter ATP-binding protein EcfA2
MSIFKFLFNDDTADERRAVRAVEKLAEEDSRKIARIIIQTLTTLQFDHWLPKDRRPGLGAAITSGKRGHQEVKFDKRGGDETTLRYHIDLIDRPYGVKATDFMQEWVEMELTLAVGLPCKIIHKSGRGLFIEVTRDGSLAGIPNVVSYEQAASQMTQADKPLEFILGMGAGQQWIKFNLATGPHILVAGTTGSGKSVFVNQMILTMVQRTAPTDLKLWMVDLKGGIELTLFESLPHVDKFVTEAEDCDAMMGELVMEVKRREGLLKGKANDINGWNHLMARQKDHQWPRIVLVIDEYAQLKALGAKAAIKKMAIILAKGRALGIHVIIATQVPNREVIEGLIKHNITVRAAFNCADYHHSMNIIANGDAYGLGTKGRFIFSLHGSLSQMQGPNLKNAEAKKLVEEIREYWSKEHVGAGQFEFARILEYALDNLQGQLPYRKLAAAYAGSVSRYQVENYLKDIAGQMVTVRDQNYMVMKHPDNNRPRYLMPMFSEEMVMPSAQQPVVLAETGET